MNILNMWSPKKNIYDSDSMFVDEKETMFKPFCANFMSLDVPKF